MANDLGCNSIHKHGEREVLWNCQLDKGKGGQKGDHLFSFLDLILFCAIHIRQMKLSWKLRNEKKKFQISISKTLVEFY